jgi:hypothetical protein
MAPADGGAFARRVAPLRVISTVDPHPRHVHKTMHQRQDGFKGYVAVEPETGLFTAVELTEACGERSTTKPSSVCPYWTMISGLAALTCLVIRRTAPVKRVR